MIESALLIGFMLGIRHALEADHIAAIAAVANSGRGGYLNLISPGMLWSFGHTITILVFAVFARQVEFQAMDQLSMFLEILVGLMLLILGLGTMRRAKWLTFHGHSHQHNKGELHSHLHLHLSEDHKHQKFQHAQFFKNGKRMITIGMIHGLAGTAAIMVLAFRSAEQNVLSGVAFILLFGVGTAISMSLFSIILNFSLGRVHHSWNKIFMFINIGIGCITVYLGLKLIYSNSYIILTT
jgi:sulfite exporter TauE/SafE